MSSKGSLEFKEATNLGDADFDLPGVVEKFAYSVNLIEGGGGWYGLTALSRDSAGALNWISGMSVTGPTPAPGTDPYFPVAEPASDSSNHLAMAVQVGGYPDANFYQLASYTVDSRGDLTSTNTYANMPTVDTMGPLKIDPTGKILAVGIDSGTQFFHFNGADPIVPYTGIIGSSGYVSEMTWDTDHHLYAINGSSGKLHVYSVTSTGASEAKGSPYLISGHPFLINSQIAVQGR